MLKFLTLLIGSFILISCGGGNNYQKNIEKLDEVYGCDNPLRPLSKKRYKECIAKERGNNESFFDVNENSLDSLFNRGSKNYTLQYSVNPYLWQAALDLTQRYPLKIADNQGGYIETDWIIENINPNNRCLIKIRVTSIELVSNGVATNFICEEKIDNQWTFIEKNYYDEEKQLTLKILSTASILSEQNL